MKISECFCVFESVWKCLRVLESVYEFLSVFERVQGVLQSVRDVKSIKSVKSVLISALKSKKCFKPLQALNVDCWVTSRPNTSKFSNFASGGPSPGSATSPNSAQFQLSSGSAKRSAFATAAAIELVSNAAAEKQLETNGSSPTKRSAFSKSAKSTKVAVELSKSRNYFSRFYQGQHWRTDSVAQSLSNKTKSETEFWILILS